MHRPGDPGSTSVIRAPGCPSAVLDAEAHPGLGELAVVVSLGQGARALDRDGEADAPTLVVDGGVDAHNLAVGVDQRAAGFPGLMAASVWMKS